MQATKKSMLSAADVSRNELSRKDSSIEQLKAEVNSLCFIVVDFCLGSRKRVD
jgi:hypothetical protein